MPKTLYLDNSVISREKKFTFLSADSPSSSSTISVQSIVGFHSLTTSSGQIILIGELGAEKSELVRTSQSTAPSGTTVTLRDSTQFDHPQDTKVYIVDWNRAEVSTAATVTGVKSTVTAYPINIQADQRETLYRDTSLASGFYFIRFNESIDNTNSDYSDPIPFGGYPDNSVASIKHRALNSIHEKIDEELVTHEFLNEALWEGRREYHQMPGKRPFRRKFNTDIGNVVTGRYRVDLPIDTEKPHTSENVFGVRIGTEANMFYYDKKDWDFDFRSIPHSTLTAAYAINSRDLYLTSVRDFAETGIVSIQQTNVEYSARSVSGGTLRISVQGSYAVSSGEDVWQNVTYGLPDRFTVWADPGGSAFIYFNRPFSTTYVDQNIYSDYYRTVVDYDTDADILDEPNYDMFISWLAWKIKQRKNKGLNPLTDTDYTVWNFKKTSSVANEYLATDIRITPDVPNFYPE